MGVLAGGTLLSPNGLPLKMLLRSTELLERYHHGHYHSVDYPSRYYRSGWWLLRPGPLVLIASVTRYVFRGLGRHQTIVDVISYARGSFFDKLIGHRVGLSGGRANWRRLRVENQP